MDDSSRQPPPTQVSPSIFFVNQEPGAGTHFIAARCAWHVQQRDVAGTDRGSRDELGHQTYVAILSLELDHAAQRGWLESSDLGANPSSSAFPSCA
jgi:hypothetical protein